MDYQPPATAIELLYQDDDILLVNKPAGLLSVPGRIHKDCLINRLQEDFPTVRCVHRLDMETSGLMVMALHKPAQAHLNKQFEQRRVKKQYQARVIGQPQNDSGEINVPLICDWPNRPKQKVDYEGGKSALTQWSVQSREALTTLLNLTPITGRSHQLRVHLWHIGLPIVADRLYQAEALNSEQAGAIEQIQQAKKRSLLHLHSTFLQFIHPSSGATLAFDSVAPF
ncbi:MAG: RluA family pseudouridine synthase [Proteobacteria bacterium]|nr:MAG: RluA family pseudouridine synthase [Pseudomonadota bacterium]